LRGEAAAEPARDAVSLSPTRPNAITTASARECHSGDLDAAQNAASDPRDYITGIARRVRRSVVENGASATKPRQRAHEASTSTSGTSVTVSRFRGAVPTYPVRSVSGKEDRPSQSVRNVVLCHVAARSPRVLSRRGVSPWI